MRVLAKFEVFDGNILIDTFDEEFDDDDQMYYYLRDQNGHPWLSLQLKEYTPIKTTTGGERAYNNVTRS